MYSYIMFLDRRAKKRELFRTIAEYKVQKAPKAAGKFKQPGTWVKAPLLDISVAGCALESPYDIPSSVVVSVKIDPLAFALEAAESRKEPLEMTGTISYSIVRQPEHYRLGVCFTKIKKKDSDLIKRFIKVKERRKFPRLDMTGL